MTDRLVIRRATLEDYQGVMDIGDIYEGRDYLPAMYEKYIKWFNCRVAEKNGEIVGFNGERLVDGGMTLCTVAARVKEAYQGQGVLAAILKDIYEFYQDKESVKYEAIATGNVNMGVNGDKIRRRFTQILQMVHVEIIGEVTDFKPNTMESDETKVQELTSEDLKEIFQSKDSCSRLFPGERIVPNWYPYRLLPENIPLMIDGSKFWGTKCSDQSKYTTLTVTEFYNLRERIVLKICVYGNDIIDIKRHFVKHIQNLRHLIKLRTCSLIMIQLIHSLDCQDAKTILSVFEKCGLTINSDFPTNTLFIFEREIK
ncbi:hypothetical protein SNE40_010697 [Patella caerulea]|uniref:N-acetyltransferase domain-containing protein n=1 Tax=Patella caerulea TaxID=87958 RepID=A0AAN8JYS7_PATCE